MKTVTTLRVLSTILILYSAHVSIVEACGKQSLTMERCKKSSDCAGNNPSAPTIVCSGRDSKDEFKSCDVSTDVETCICYAQSFKYCNQHSECPDEHYCGVSARTNNSLCVGCAVFYDKDIKFEPISKMPLDRCQTAEHPPCGSTNDFCSPSMDCAGGKTCLFEEESETFECGTAQSPCRCAFSDGKVAGVTPCSQNDDCESPREACAYAIVSNQNFCMSCDAARLSSDHIVNDTTKCDDLEEERPAPKHYLRSPNGRNFDLCVYDEQCTGGRTCVQFASMNKKPKPLKKCSGVQELCFCREKKLTSCKTGKDCVPGESCAVAEELDVNNNCVSNSLLDSLSTRNYKITGKLAPNGNGKGLSNDVCRFDWNCKAPRRCTHIQDRFGGCAGRKACACQPLTRPECFSNGDCDDGESCVNIIDSRAKPFCSSTEVLKSSDNLVPFNFEAPKPTPINSTDGLTRDPCTEDENCLGKRKCTHLTEAQTSCDGRNGCYCQFQSPDFAQACNTSTDCTTSGEICVGVEGDVRFGSNCMSAQAFDRENSEDEQEFGPRPSLSVSPTVSPTVSTSTSPLSSPNPSTDEGGEPSISVEASISPMAVSGGNANEDQSTGASEGSVEPSEEESAVCIDVKLLTDYKKQDLVFNEHRRSGVLCDSSGSCATPGHMITFNGKAMSMKSYCNTHAENGCNRRVTWVNSPRMKYGVRISSLTSNLQMTALSARYESWLEEAFLSRIIQHFQA